MAEQGRRSSTAQNSEEIDKGKVTAIPTKSETIPQNSIEQLIEAVSGVPLDQIRRHIELIQVKCTELPNSEELARFIATVNQARQQLDTVPAQVDDIP